MVTEALERELEGLPESLRWSTLAAAAKAMAAELDKPSNSATSKSMCAKQLREALAELRALAPPREEADRIDDLRARRDRRLAKA